MRERLARLVGRARGGDGDDGDIAAQVIARAREELDRLDPADRRIAERALPYTMTGVARLAATIDAARLDPNLMNFLLSAPSYGAGSNHNRVRRANPGRFGAGDFAKRREEEGRDSTSRPSLRWVQSAGGRFIVGGRRALKIPSCRPRSGNG